MYKEHYMTVAEIIDIEFIISLLYEYTNYIDSGLEFHLQCFYPCDGYFNDMLMLVYEIQIIWLVNWMKPSDIYMR